MKVIKFGAMAAMLALAGVAGSAHAVINYTLVSSSADALVLDIHYSDGADTKSWSDAFWTVESSDTVTGNGVNTVRDLSVTFTHLVPSAGPAVTINVSSVGVGSTFSNSGSVAHGTGTDDWAYNAISVTGGQAKTQLSVTHATPVPEPATVAMMLSGIGLLGFLSRRRRED